jgi:hypothetical protein
MGIVQNIPRKQGRLQVRPDFDQKKPAIFGPGNKPGDTVGHITNPSDPLVYLQSNDSYATLRTQSNKNPVGTMINTATQRTIAPMAPVGTGNLVRPIGAGSEDFAEVAPHEHGSFFSPKVAKTAPVRTSGGVNKATDTPFHPVKGVQSYRPRRSPAKAGERTLQESFDSTKHLTGNPLQDATVSAVISSGGSTSKWGGVKVSAADNIHPASGVTLSQPEGKVLNHDNNSRLKGNVGLTSTGKGIGK